MGRFDEVLESGKLDRVIDAFKGTIDYWADKELERTRTVSSASDWGSRAKIAFRAYETGVERAVKILEDDIEMDQSLRVAVGERAVNDLLDELVTVVFVPYTLQKFDVSFLDWTLLLPDRDDVEPAARSLANSPSRRFRLLASRGNPAFYRGPHHVNR